MYSKIIAIAFPIPLPPPVIKATLFNKENFVFIVIIYSDIPLFQGIKSF